MGPGWALKVKLIMGPLFVIKMTCYFFFTTSTYLLILIILELYFIILKSCNLISKRGRFYKDFNERNFKNLKISKFLKIGTSLQ